MADAASLLRRARIASFGSPSIRARPPTNAKCRTFFTKKQDGLDRDWGRHRVFCNPPYGRAMSLWARKCFRASRAGALVVLLAHARTDTRWFHDWVYGKADEIRFVRGRLKFGDGRQSAPFPSLVAVFLPRAAAERKSRCHVIVVTWHPSRRR